MLQSIEIPTEQRDTHSLYLRWNSKNGSSCKTAYVWRWDVVLLTPVFHRWN